MSSKIRAQSAVKRPLSRSKVTPTKKKENSDWDIEASQYNKTYQKLKSEISPLGNPKVVSSFKTLTMVRAYRPEMLKECLVNEKNASKKYGSTGECGLNSMFIKTALITFRDWRDKIYSKLTLVVDVVADSEDLLEEKLEQQVRGAIEQLKGYSHKIQEQLQRFIALKEQSYKLIKLHEKYTVLLDTIEHVLKLIDCMQALNNEIGIYLEAKKSVESSMEALQQGVRKISEGYEERARDSLNYCSCHPQNQMLLRLQYKVRRMFKRSTDKVMAIFESIKQLQKYESHFQTKMNFLSSFQDLSHEFLQHTLDTLYNKNEEIRNLEKKFFVSKQPQFISLRAKIEDWQTNFINILRAKTLRYLKECIVLLNGLRTLHLFKNKGKQYSQIKKKLILLSKIYQQSEKESNLATQTFQLDRNTMREIIGLLDETVNTASPHIIVISAQIEKMDGLGKRTGTGKEVEKCCEDLQTIQKTQSFLWKLLNAAYVKMSRLQKQNADTIQECGYLDKQKMENLHQLLTFSRNQQLNNDIFRCFDGKKSMKIIHNEDFNTIFTNYQQKCSIHLQFLKTGLELGIERNLQLKEILKQELISYLFNQQFKNEFISVYPVIKQVSSMQEKIMSLAVKDFVNNMRLYYIEVGAVQELRRGVNDEIKKLERSRHRSLFNKYIIFLYENTLINLLNMKTIYTLYVNHQNQLQPFRTVFHMFTDIYEKTIIKRGQQGEFGVLAAKINEISQQLNAENKLAFEYASSCITNQYFPANSYLEEWLLYEFSSEMEDSVSKTAISLKRAQTKLMFNSFINRLEAQREKFRASKMAESKDIYQHISTNLLQLKKFTFEQTYRQLQAKIMEYLRKLNIPHSAVFTKDQAPVYILIDIIEESIVNRVIFKRLNIDYRNTKSVLLPFQLKTIKQIKVDTMKQSKIAMPVKANEIEEGMAEEIDGSVEMNQQIAEEQIIQLHSDLPLTSEIKPNVSIQKDVRSVFSEERPRNQPPNFQYFLLSQIQSVAHLKTCLYYNKNKFANIQSKLNINILCKSLMSQGRAQAIKHLQDILLEFQAHNLVRLMNLSETMFECQEKISKYKEALNRKSERIDDDLAKVFEYFKVQTKILYNQEGNSIVSFRKQNERSCYIHANLKQNSLRKDLSYFKIEDIQQSIWQCIASGNKDINQKVPKINQLINRTNAQLLTYYEEIQRKLSVINEIQATNKREISDIIYKFQNEQLNNRFLLTTIRKQITTQKDLVDWITIHEKQLKQVTVINAYNVFKLDDLVLRISSLPIDQYHLAQCLLIPFTKQLAACISFDKGDASIKSLAIRQLVINQTARNKLSFNQLKKSIDEHEMKYITSQMATRQKLINLIRAFQNYAAINDGQLAKMLEDVASDVQKQISLLHFLLSQDYKNIQTVQEISYNKDIQCKQNKFLKSSLNYNNSSFLQQFSIHLSKCKINHHTLQVSNRPINIFEKFDIAAFADWFSFGPAQTVKLQTNISSNANIHTIKRLFVTFVNIILPFEKQEPAVAEQIRQLLSLSTVHVKSGKQAFTANCLQLLESNAFEVEVNWPKNPIYICYQSPNSSFQLQLQQNQYYYYSQMEIISMRIQLKKQYQQIKSNYLSQKQRAEEEARRERIKKQLYLKELKLREQAEQLQRLRHEQQITKLIFETEEIKRAMREKEVQQKVKLQFIEEMTRKRLQQEYSKDVKYQQKQLKDKLNHLSSDIDPTKSQPIEAQIEFQLVLSDGQGQLFNQLRHSPSYDVQYDYKMTLYQYIRQTYYNLRRPKQISIEQWYHHF